MSLRRRARTLTRLRRQADRRITAAREAIVRVRTAQAAQKAAERRQA